MIVEMVMGAFAFLAFASVAGLVYACHLLRDAARVSTDVTARAVSSLAMVKGLAPHAAAPEVFNPGGRSWDAVEAERIERVDTAQQSRRAHRLMELNDARRHFEAQGDAERVAKIDSQLKAYEMSA